MIRTRLSIHLLNHAALDLVTNSAVLLDRESTGDKVGSPYLSMISDFSYCLLIVIAI